MLIRKTQNRQGELKKKTMEDTRDIDQNKVIKKLKKELSKLRKQLSGQEPYTEEDSTEPMDITNKIHQTGAPSSQCPNCLSNSIGVFITPMGKRRYGCKTCKKFKR